MAYRFSHSAIAGLLTGILLTSSLPVQAALDLRLPESSPDAVLDRDLPDIGTAGGSVLSINQEKELGDFYLRQMRGKAPLISDPLLDAYIAGLGQRLVRHADSVQTPFNFLLIRNNNLNAFAFFGGNVVLHSGLILTADNESELASVIAHEISHVTQRHLARAMEEQQRSAPLTWAATIGSILLTMANPQMGMAALSSTLAGTQQNMISFTQSNEQEADRIGIALLSRAGFDPQGSPSFLEKLAAQYRYASKPPEILLTHPLPESRLAEAQTRANRLPQRHPSGSLEFQLAKIRLLGMYGSGENTLSSATLNQMSAQGNALEKQAAQYGKALLAYHNRQYAQARTELQQLLTQSPKNQWYIDLMTDIDIGQNRGADAVRRLQQALQSQPDSRVLQLNLANAYYKAGQSQEAIKRLERYTFANPNDLNGWGLSAEVYAALGQRDAELAARAENSALQGNFDEAITLLTNASQLVKVNSLKQARYDARIDQLRQLQNRYSKFKS
ncbi:M48 family metallopeptidase [Plesiomonas shigelloides]|uniref:Beta-barrel assembly-enhancing protease n=1 Tax=Plesiomonas shigelloides TaxID=703 RepID=A0A8I1W7U7_PLESH|nr:M48 family metallopeptidase [Plesiomonas shigelloides]MBO1108811.1 M48 family metallopeptidase [Plesiomonas shigelloides]